MKLMQESIDAAQELVQQLKEIGLDYSKYELQIAEEMFENGILRGLWDTVVHFDDKPSLRIINEDEYEQHMDEDDVDTPEWDDIIFTHSYGYVWFA
ncbi:MAG TPA: hypothetical protein VFM18_05365 [Methanosarcina sp.]|nr:hypothetical protein [Methanosarcina sp.]